MSITLQNYLNDVMRLLHDSGLKYWTQAELTDYINKARKLTVAETGCTRRLATVDIASASTLAGATYDFASLVPTRQVIDVLDIMLKYSGTSVMQLRYIPFGDVVRMPAWQYQTTGTPQIYTIHNRSAILLPWPSAAYTGTIFDCIVEPVDLALVADVDSDVYHPYSECVGFYAAYLAKLKDQRRQEAEEFLNDYQRRKMQAVGTAFQRRLVGT